MHNYRLHWRDFSRVWVRVGNCSKQKLLEIFRKHWETIKQELEAGAFLVEVV
ncbi:DUF5615 family PIN-like protein [Thiothrix subterranea]|uniref:DUF5615 family PIN-like protein n=1 Tax=Thiothrix subterranea TaxID=2735563 RepID=UPI0035A69D51